ncbi:MAG: sensor histidine kinase [Lachnospiraceae bacterium]|jgi:hypothetical protein|nr:sensor histidine kinase [Lachnospiraceae bacterium]
MEDVLILRDFVWFLRYVGWTALFFVYLAPLPERSVKRSLRLFCFAVLLALSTLLQYRMMAQLTLDIGLNTACWIAVCLILRRTHWTNALYGALAFGIINDLSKVISHDLAFGFLLEPRLHGLPSIGSHLIYTASNLAVGLACVLLFRRLIFKNDKQQFGFLPFSLILLPPVVYFYARNYQFVLLNVPQLSDSRYIMPVYILLLLLGFSALLISILADSSLSVRIQQEERRHMQELLEKQRQEFISQKSASEAIRQKYHDLKNCLLALRAENSSSPSRTRFMEEIDQIMRPLETDVETGNPFLNIVLADKIRLCQEKEIRLTPYVNGQCLSFLDGLDLCVIAGNALDNAVEAVEKLPVEKREIHMKISRSGNMVLLCFHNYHSGGLTQDAAGFYRTSKPDPRNHGYGLKGISQTLSRYDGSMAIEASEEEFTLNILIPVPEK